MAGVLGFEPRYAEIKTPCLTTWRHPKLCMPTSNCLFIEQLEGLLTGRYFAKEMRGCQGGVFFKAGDVSVVAVFRLRHADACGFRGRRVSGSR